MTFPVEEEDKGWAIMWEGGVFELHEFWEYSLGLLGVGNFFSKDFALHKYFFWYKDIFHILVLCFESRQPLSCIFMLFSGPLASVLDFDDFCWWQNQLCVRPYYLTFQMPLPTGMLTCLCFALVWFRFGFVTLWLHFILVLFRFGFISFWIRFVLVSFRFGFISFQFRFTKYSKPTCFTSCM